MVDNISRGQVLQVVEFKVDIHILKKSYNSEAIGAASGGRVGAGETG